MTRIDPEGLVSEGEHAYLYQKVSKSGEHLKYGVTNNPNARYTPEELAGGRLRIVAQGTREGMLALERELHMTLPLGPEERQLQYIKLQKKKGLKTQCPPRRGIARAGRGLGIIGLLSGLLNAYEAAKIADETGKSILEVQLEMTGYTQIYLEMMGHTLGSGGDPI